MIAVIIGSMMAAGRVQAAGERILFVIGGSNTAGFLEGNSVVERNEHRAEIGNSSTSNGNHGWGSLALALGAAGFVPEEIAEGSGAVHGSLNVGSAVAFETMDLSVYAAIVMGSNNASYSPAQVDAIERFVRGGGGVLFISDANFGGSWEGNPDTGWQDASNSDQQFLDRFGLRMNQDRGTYAAARSSGHFSAPGHPLLANGVDEIHGEGVTPVSLGPPVPGVRSQTIVRVPGNQDVGVNTAPFNGEGRGGSRDSTAADGVVAIALAGAGRVVGHFDRNTFFNDNGAGSDITRSDNLRFALNLFAWLTENRNLSAPANGWEAYRRKRFNELDRPLASVSGPAADPDEDGLPNWREALHGLDPHRGDLPGALSGFIAVSPVEIRWRFRRGDEWDDASLRIAVSPDLATWENLTPDSALVLESVPGGAWIEYGITPREGGGFWRFEFDPAAAAP